jgi:hypothetical protein
VATPPTRPDIRAGTSRYGLSTNPRAPSWLAGSRKSLRLSKRRFRKSHGALDVVLFSRELIFAFPSVEATFASKPPFE